MEFSINYLHFHIFILNNIIFNHVSSKLSMTSIVLNLMTNFLSLSFVNSQKNLMQLGSSFFSWWFYFSFSFLFFSSVLMWLLTLLISSPRLSTIFHHYFPITLVTSEIILIYFFFFFMSALLDRKLDENKQSSASVISVSPMPWTVPRISVTSGEINWYIKIYNM